MGNQAENVSVASGTTSRNSQMDESQENIDEPDAPSLPTVTVSKPCKRTVRKTWTREEYCHVMWCYYYCSLDPSTKTGIVKATFDLWTSKYPGEQPNDQFDANKLANVRRFIVKQKKLSDVELDNIKIEVRQALNQSSPEPQSPSQEPLSSQEELSQDRQHISCPEIGLAAVQNEQQSIVSDDSCIENTQLYFDIMNIWEEVKCTSFIDRRKPPRILIKTSKQRSFLMRQIVA